MKFKVEVGNYEVIESNFILMDQNETEVAIYLKMDRASKGKLVMKFVEDASGEKGIKGHIREGNLYITCYNFDSAAEVATNKAIVIADYNGKNIKLQFRCSFVGNGEIRKVEYTIYKEK